MEKLSDKCTSYNKEAATLSEIPIQVIQQILNLEYQNAEMHEALKLYIMDLKNVVPESDARNNRMAQIESLIDEIENES